MTTEIRRTIICRVCNNTVHYERRAGRHREVCDSCRPIYRRHYYRIAQESWRARNPERDAGNQSRARDMAARRRKAEAARVEAVKHEAARVEAAGKSEARRTRTAEAAEARLAADTARAVHHA